MNEGLGQRRKRNLALGLLGGGTVLLWTTWPQFCAILWGGGDSVGSLGLRSMGIVLVISLLATKVRRWWLGLLGPLLILACLGQALLIPNSHSRRCLLFYSKLSQIRRGRLAYCDQWGWVDRRHRLLDVWRQLRRSPSKDPVIIEHLFFGGPSLKIWQGWQGYQIRLQCEPLSDTDCLRIVQLLGERCELEESRLPWWSGGPLSSYNVDDLSSVYFTIFSLANPATKFEMADPQRSEEIWHQQGWNLVEQTIHDWREFHPLSYRAEFQDLMQRLSQQSLKAGHSTQMQVSGPLRLD